MIINITSDHGQIGPLRWINSNQIPHEMGGLWFIQWGATFRMGAGTIRLQEVQR